MKTSLYYREGSSDKEYHVEVVPANGLFLVNFAFGRRGSTLNTGCKTPSPVDGSFVVQAVNSNRRSVALCLYDSETAVNVGNVTVPPNQPIPHPRAIVQVR